MTLAGTAIGGKASDGDRGGGLHEVAAALAGRCPSIPSGIVWLPTAPGRSPRAAAQGARTQGLFGRQVGDSFGDSQRPGCRASPRRSKPVQGALGPSVGRTSQTRRGKARESLSPRRGIGREALNRQYGRRRGLDITPHLRARGRGRLAAGGPAGLARAGDREGLLAAWGEDGRGRSLVRRQAHIRRRTVDGPKRMTGARGGVRRTERDATLAVR
jgi:hypothetical protein